jgi:hypothetical protein
MPRKLKSLEQVKVAGNPSRLTRAELAQRERAEAESRHLYGTPDAPADLDGAEQRAWDALIVRYGDRLHLNDADQLAEIARVQVLLDSALRTAKRGAMLRGKRNPAFAQAIQLTKMRRELLGPILARLPAPKTGKSPMDRLDEIIRRSEVN